MAKLSVGVFGKDNARKSRGDDPRSTGVDIDRRIRADDLDTEIDINIGADNSSKVADNPSIAANNLGTAIDNSSIAADNPGISADNPGTVVV